MIFAGQSSALRKVHLKIPFLANLPALFLHELRFGAQRGSQIYSRVCCAVAPISTVMDGF